MNMSTTGQGGGEIGKEKEKPFSMEWFFTNVMFEAGETGVANSKDRGHLVTEQPGFVTEQMPDSTRKAGQLAEEAEVAGWHPNSICG
jgi:hypothetical protein